MGGVVTFENGEHLTLGALFAVSVRRDVCEDAHTIAHLTNVLFNDKKIGIGIFDASFDPPVATRFSEGTDAVCLGMPKDFCHLRTWAQARAPRTKLHADAITLQQAADIFGEEVDAFSDSIRLRDEESVTTRMLADTSYDAFHSEEILRGVLDYIYKEFETANAPAALRTNPAGS
jgi:hypothetical protein